MIPICSSLKKIIISPEEAATLEGLRVKYLVKLKPYSKHIEGM
jgi:hypothetical protein